MFLAVFGSSGVKVHFRAQRVGFCLAGVIDGVESYPEQNPTLQEDVSLYLGGNSGW